MKLEWDSNTSSIIGKHMQELAEEKEKVFQQKSILFFQERTSLQQKIENDRRDLEQAHTRNVRDMQERLTKLEEATKVCLFYSRLIRTTDSISGVNKFEIPK